MAGVRVAGRPGFLLVSAFAGGVLVSVSVALASVALPGAPAAAPAAAPVPVASAAAVFQSAVALSDAAGGGLLGAVVRPSLPPRPGVAPSGRWVLSVSFGSRFLAVAFAVRWSAALGLFLRVRGSRRSGFSVSVSLLAPPASAVSSSFVPAGGSAAVAAFVRRLSGLAV